MKKTISKIVVMTSLLAATAVSINVTDVKADNVNIEAKLDQMSKYTTTSIDEEGNQVISMDSMQFTQYLLDNGVPSNEIPAILKERHHFKLFHVQKLKGHHNYNIYITREAVVLYHSSAVGGHLIMSILKAAGEDYSGAVDSLGDSIKDVFETASTKHGYLIKIRDGHYKGHEAWDSK